MSQTIVGNLAQQSATRKAKLAKAEAREQAPTTLRSFVRELRDPMHRRRPSQYFNEAREYVFAVVLKKGALSAHAEVARRLTKAKLHLCFLEPDEEIHPGVLCILVKAPQEALHHEMRRLSVEHFIRTGVYMDASGGADGRGQGKAQGGQRSGRSGKGCGRIGNGTEIVLLDRILQRALMEHAMGGREKSSVPDWRPVMQAARRHRTPSQLSPSQRSPSQRSPSHLPRTRTLTRTAPPPAQVSIVRTLIDGVESFFPLHDEHFAATFLGKVHAHQRPATDAHSDPAPGDSAHHSPPPAAINATRSASVGKVNRRMRLRRLLWRKARYRWRDFVRTAWRWRWPGEGWGRSKACPSKAGWRCSGGGGGGGGAGAGAGAGGGGGGGGGGGDGGGHFASPKRRSSSCRPAAARHGSRCDIPAPLCCNTQYNTPQRTNVYSTPAPALASSGEDEECSYEEGGDEEHSSLYGELTHHFGEETGAYFAFFQVMSSLTAL
jgi:hypothetical protein